jgi:hypothetical protein
MSLVVKHSLRVTPRQVDAFMYLNGAIAVDEFLRNPELVEEIADRFAAHALKHPE